MIGTTAPPSADEQTAPSGLIFREESLHIGDRQESGKQLLLFSFFCWGRHVRILAERMEHAPIRWANCPYANF
jgi:hypothetical protein